MEELLVENLADRYRLLKSPGLLFGLAAGDTFVLGADGKPVIVTRSRNLCVQIFCENAPARQAELNSKFETLGGRLDGLSPGLLVYTVHVDVGFPKIERVMREIEGEDSDMEWYYGNVYGEDGITPLDWWK